MTSQKVIVGFSGGKDSTTAAILLKNQGFDVHALTMRMGLKDENEKIEKIQHLAHTLDIPIKIIDVTETFNRKVIDYFLSAYAHNLTPNPCVICNNEIKFNLLMNEAFQTEQADYYATGHYAQKTVINGSYFLTEPLDRTKSQIYFLSMIGNKVLEKVLFPIAELSIDQVRDMTRNLPLANKAESQDVCFLSDLRLIDYLKSRLPVRFFKEGDILDIEGNKIGKHNGAVYFTIGQRRGTGFSSAGKLYVVKKDVRANTITLGSKEHLYSHHVEIIQPVYWKSIFPGDTFKAKFRYMSPFHDVTIRSVSEKEIVADFRQPVESITPGQIGVFYQNDIIVAAGIIQ